jgi:hypothetical protein
MKLWNIRGVSEEHRRRAKVAAAQSGVTLGKWLEGAIDRAAGAESSTLTFIEGEKNTVSPLTQSQIRNTLTATR